MIEARGNNMKQYRTAEVAALAGIHPNTVRLYEQWGLIPRLCQNSKLGEPNPVKA